MDLFKNVFICTFIYRNDVSYKVRSQITGCPKTLSSDVLRVARGRKRKICTQILKLIA